jgi:dihydroneopterin aldolase
MDRVEVRGLSFHAKHGCHAEERKTGGPFEVDVLIDCDFSKAAVSDRIEDAIDYVAIMDLAATVMARPQNLIEHVAQTLAKAVLERFDDAQRCTVTIKKLQPPVSHQLQYVAVTRILDRSVNN